MKNNKVFLSIIAALGLSVSAMSAQAAVISVTTGSNPYYQYQQQNLGAVQTQNAEPESLPESQTNIQARQRMQTMNQQSTQMNSNDPSAQAYSQAASINGNTQGQGQYQQQQGQDQSQNQQQDQQNTGPKNAYEQGFGQEQANADRQAALEDWISGQSARQQGETIPVPKPLNVVANDKSSRIWLINWKGVLVEQVGLKPEKVDFEASRLNKEDFAAWASRQVRYVEPNAIAVNP